MAKAKSAKSAAPNDSAAKLSFKTKLWLAADKLRNNSDWFRKDDGVCWQYGVPAKGNTNFA